MSAAPSPLVAAAYHEAGHAVVAAIERIPVKSATIAAAGYTARAVTLAARVRARGIDMSRGSAERRARIALAGETAQHRHARQSSRLDDAVADRGLASSLAAAISGSPREAEAWLALWRIQVEECVAARWPAVEAVAVALIRHRTLTAAQIDAAIAGIVQTCTEDA